MEGIGIMGNEVLSPLCRAEAELLDGAPRS